VQAPGAQAVEVRTDLPEKKSEEKSAEGVPEASAEKPEAMTLESHLDDLLALREAAKQNNQMSAAISAEVSRGKAAGLYVERSQVEVKVDFNQVEARIAALMTKLGGSGRAGRR